MIGITFKTISEFLNRLEKEVLFDSHKVEYTLCKNVATQITCVLATNEDFSYEVIDSFKQLNDTIYDTNLMKRRTFYTECPK